MLKLLLTGLLLFAHSVNSDVLSPLDGSGQSDIPGFWAGGVDYSKDELPDCIAACSEHVFPLLAKLFQKGSNKRRIMQSCSIFDRAEKCMKQLTHCPRNEIYLTLTSGIRYMCVEQRKAFEANAPCMDKVHDTVYNQCDMQCHPEALVNGFALKDAFTNGFTKGLDFGIVQKFIDPHLSKLFISESCRIGQCLLKCFRNKFNIHCDGSAGSLLAEAIVRPFGSHDLQQLPFGAVFGSFLPQQCKFVYDTNIIKKYRINPELDKELKRMYSNGERKVKTTEERVVESINNLEPVLTNPFEQATNMIKAATESPIDTGYKSLSRARRNNIARPWHAPKAPIDETPLTKNSLGPVYNGHLSEPAPLFRAHDPAEHEFDYSGSGSGVTESFDNEATPTWQTVEDLEMSGSGDEHTIELGARPDTSGVIPLSLQRTVDNADLYLAQWIQPHKTYKVSVNVENEDEGELVCLLRTYKGFAVNKLTDEDMDDLVDEIEKL